MNVCEAIEKLTRFERNVPEDALDVLRCNWSEAEPLLLAEMDRVIANPTGAEEKALLFYAMYLCAEMRSEAAFERYVAFCRLPGRAQDFWLGDLRLESMDHMLALTCAGRTDALKELVEDERVCEYARASALQALRYLAFGGIVSREMLESYCLELLGWRLEQRPGYIWNELMMTASGLRMKQALPLIELAYEYAWADSWFSSPDEVRGEMRKPEVRTCADLDSTEAEMSMFTRNWDSDPEELSDSDLLALPHRKWRKKAVSAGMEPGRNDPCPCGSGRKYKKCCIMQGLAVSDDAIAAAGFVPLNKADEWIAAGYFYRDQGHTKEARLCWRKGWAEVLRIMPKSISDPDDDEADELFDSCEYFGSWLQDYLDERKEEASRNVLMIGDVLTFIDDALQRFPEMEHDLVEDFEQAKIKLLLWSGEPERAFEILHGLQRNSAESYVWYDFEADITGWDAPEYDLRTDWKRALMLNVEGRMKTSDPDLRSNFDSAIEHLERLIKEDCVAREKRKALFDAIQSGNA